jgi:hypothetical protein
MNRKGDWIQTYTGKKFYPLDPRPEDICIEDIAHALALTCRYNGHCKFFYSVAEHSVRSISTTDLLPELAEQRWLLMHDAAEAYIGDVPRPIKPMLSEFKEIENYILKVIGFKFQLGNIPHNKIERADRILLSTEKRDVMVSGTEWFIPLPNPMEKRIIPWSWVEAEKTFLAIALALNIK